MKPNINIDGVQSYYKEFPSLRIREDKIAEAKSTLNEEQGVLFDKLIEFVQSPVEYFVIGGYAGTGKTYTISKFISVLDEKIAVTAPTNKAVKILADNAELGNNGNISYSTIHKLLALKVTWQAPKKKGQLPRQILTRNLYAEVTINEYRLIILDEASMLSFELFNILHQEKNKILRVIFMGDPAQIPPVNEIDSIPLLPEKREKFGMLYFELSLIMRQALNSKILKIAYRIRDQRYREGDLIDEFRINDSDDVLFFNADKETKAFIELMLSHFTDQSFEENPNYAKVIAWTNETVNYYNQLIRQKIFKTEALNKIIKGDKLIADSAIIDNREVVFNTSDEFEVIDYEIKDLYYVITTSEDEELFSNQENGGIRLKYYHTLVKYQYPVKLQLGENPQERYFHKYIDILHEDYEKVYELLLKRLARIGRETNKWADYYSMMERFAKVKYNYAITAHKSQGSTYQNVFIIEDDIDKNPRYIERNRIKYTAFTRPKNKLFILTSKTVSEHKPMIEVIKENVEIPE